MRKRRLAWPLVFAFAGLVAAFLGQGCSKGGGTMGPSSGYY